MKSFKKILNFFIIPLVCRTIIPKFENNLTKNLKVHFLFEPLRASNVFAISKSKKVKRLRETLFLDFDNTTEYILVMNEKLRD